MEAIKLCRLDTPIIFIEVHILSLHDALPISWCCKVETGFIGADALRHVDPRDLLAPFAFTGPGIPRPGNEVQDRKSTRLNSSHASISYSVYCLYKNTNKFEQICRHRLRRQNV